MRTSSGNQEALLYLKPGQKLRVKQALARKRMRKKARRETEYIPSSPPTYCEQEATRRKIDAGRTTSA